MPDTQNNDRKLEVGFLGTGIMGAPMAARVLSAGFRVTVWNRSVGKTDALAQAGARVATRCADALRRVDVVVCMLSTGAVVDEVLFERDENGNVAVQEMKQGAVLVVMSSIPMEASQRHAKYLARFRVEYVDAPVSGGEKGAKAGQLTIMAGGDGSVIDRVRGVLEVMGTVTHVGPAGMGQLTKLANQLIVGVTIGAVAEALLLAKRAGADLHAVRKALLGGFADSTVLRVHGEKMQEGDFAPGAPAVYQLKDLRTAQNLAAGLSMNLPLLWKITKLYEEMCATDLRDLDHSALYVHLTRAMER